jgi:hypothetical protein
MLQIQRFTVHDSVQEPGLPGTTGLGVKRPDAPGPFSMGLDERLNKVVPTDEQRRADAETWVQRVGVIPLYRT